MAGLTLTAEDKDFLAHPCISGVILFTRNFESHDQLRKLTDQITQINSKLMILVDQEGGRVQRFRQGFTALPSMSSYGKTYITSPEKAISDLKNMTETMIHELQDVGVTTTLAPVLDLDYGHSEIIGERSFGRDPELVTKLAGIVIDTMRTAGFKSTAKHFPGHGHVKADSHLELPVDNRDLKTIVNNDLAPFLKLKDKYDFLMPAHIIFSKVDHRPVGFSPVWLKDILRKQYAFRGQIMTDDLSMEGAAAYGDYRARAQAALEAGCDLLLVCNNRKGATEVVEFMEKINGHFHPTAE